MANIEDIKAKMLEARAAAASGDYKSSAAAMDAASTMLDGLEDPETVRKLAAHHDARRQGVRHRARLDVAHYVRGELDATANVPHVNGNTFRDGMVSAFERVHGHVQNVMDNTDPDTDPVP